MKLHLPSGLRKSLLACLASLALPVTLSTGTAFFFGASCSIYLSAPAAAYYVGSTERWDDTSNTGEDVTIGSGGELSIVSVKNPMSFTQRFTIEQGGKLILNNRGEARDGSGFESPSKGLPMALHGAVSGEGELVLIGGNDADIYNLRNHPGIQLHGETFSGALTLDNAVVELTGNLNVTGLGIEDTSDRIFGAMFSTNVIRKSSNVADDVEFNIYVESGESDVAGEAGDYDYRGLTVESGVVFVKSGEGSFDLNADITARDLDVRQGTLRISGDITYAGRFKVGGTLEVTKEWNIYGYSTGVLELSNGGVVSMNFTDPERDGGHRVYIQNLEVGAGGGVLRWDDKANKKAVRYWVGTLSSVSGVENARLVVESGSDTPAAYTKELEIDKIFNYDGEIVIRDGSVFLGTKSMDNMTAPGTIDPNAGWVEQQTGYDAVMKVESGQLMVHNFRKLGNGSFSVQNEQGEWADIKVGGNGLLWMNYEGDLRIGDIGLAASADFIYTSCDEDKTLHVSYEKIAESFSPGIQRYIDISRVEKSAELADPQKGINLGIWTRETNEVALANYIKNLDFQFRNMEQYASSLVINYNWRMNEAERNNYLWLSVGLTDEARKASGWDSAWGMRSLFAPTRDEMNRRGIEIRDKTSESAESGGTRFETEVGYLFKNDVGTVIWQGTKEGSSEAVYNVLPAKFFTMVDGEYTEVGNTLQLAFSSDLRLPSMANDWQSMDPHIRWETNHKNDGTDDGPHVFAFSRKSGVSAVRLDAESSTKYSAPTATVLGGRLYTQEDADDKNYANHRNARFLSDWASYIMLAGNGDTRYHLLVGGSSCVGSREGADGSDGTAMGGFQGATHIQVGKEENGGWSYGGKVDYIVGGNHVNNSAFTFQGSTYISIMRGDVVGSIVGGNTLTKGTDNTNLYAFQGASNIYIYTPLQNMTETVDGEVRPVEAPRISDGTPSVGGVDGADGKGASFTAVVGGNAWIDLPNTPGVATQNMSPTFHGNSYITVEIEDGALQGRSFDKDIVGGNYTAYTGTLLGAGVRNTIFDGNASISITVPDELEFNGVINGASRRASGGSGTTNFTGNAEVSIHGGTYKNVVAGGLAFDAGADGNHSAKLTGDTVVRLDRGVFWRVAGSSISLGGGVNASELHEGDSTVLILGGEFGTEHVVERKPAAGGEETEEGELQPGEEEPASEPLKAEEMAFVAGGSYYSGNRGRGHEHHGRAQVIITPTNATKFNGVHIVGGDYVDASPATGSGTNEVSVAADSTGVRLGSLENNNAKLEVSGLVVGGSWLADNGMSGSVSAGNTAVEVYAGQVSAVADDAETGGHHHSGVAVVGGNALVDEGTVAGSHTVTVSGESRITIGDARLAGPTVKGHVVGGSYASESGGRNTLSSADVRIDIRSGVIEGNVYGGHYSESTTAPDKLTLGGVSITMTGGSVKGDMVGGAYRATGSDSAGASDQGAIRIDLQGGSLEGNVYAAGMAGGQGGGYAVSNTKSTWVRLGKEFKLVNPKVTDAESGEATEAALTISGGYGRVSDVKRGLVGAATLVLENEAVVKAVNETGQVKLEEFTEIDLAGGLSLNLGERFVVARSSNDGRSNVFTKSGDGELLVDTLGIWNSDDNRVESNFSGRIVVNGGTLKMTVARSIDPGLGFGLDTLAGHNTQQDAYLQVAGGLTLTKKVELAFTGTAEALSKVAYGTYYLATGLSEDVTDDKDFDYDEEWLDRMNKELESSARYLQVRVVAGNLVALVRDTADRKLFFWEGAESNEWTDTSRAAWSESNTEPLGAALPAGHNVYFSTDAVNQSVPVVVRGVVTPRSIWVQKGEYAITGEEGAALNVGGAKVNALDLGTDKKPLERQLGVSQLAVGGEGRDAKLTLGVKAERLDYALLKDRGTLTLDAEGALLSGESGTKIAFQGGVLEYGKDFTADMSELVQALGSGETDSTGRVRVSVADAKKSVTWGSKDATLSNAGIDLALSKGVDKLGAGSLTMEWTAPEGTAVAGGVRVAGGELVYRVHAGGTSAKPGITLSAGAALEVQRGTLTLEMVGNGHAAINRKFTGSGTVQLRKAAGSGSTATAPFFINADNGDFTGTVALTGNSSAGMGDVALLSSGRALGGAGTTLKLAGMGFMMPGDYKPLYTQPGDGDNPDTFEPERMADVQVKSLSVAAGTVNYVGGTAAQPAGNANLYLKTPTLQGGGTLANAWGNGTFEYAHTLESSLEAFTGAIVAGDVRTRADKSSSITGSSWTLVAEGGMDLAASFAGNGTIIFNLDSVRATRLVGRLGDEKAGDATSLENTGSSELVIARGRAASLPKGEKENCATGSIITHGEKGVGIVRLGDSEYEGVWGGKTLRGDGAFVLTNGVLTNGITYKDEARLLVETVARQNNANMGTGVDVGGTLGSRINGITISAGGHLSGVGGDINVGTGYTPAGRPINGSEVSLSFGVSNIASKPGSENVEDYLIEMQEGNVVVNDPTLLRLDFTNEAFARVLESMTVASSSEVANVAWLHVMTGGELVIDKEHYSKLLAVSKDSENGMAAMLGVLGFRVEGVVGGDLGIAGRASEVYTVKRNEGDPGNEGNDPTVPPADSNGHGYGILSAYIGTLVTKGKTLTINLTDKPINEPGEVNAEALARDVAAGGAVVNNLVGELDSGLVVNNGLVLNMEEGETVDLTNAANRVSVVLNNTANYEAHIGSEAAQKAEGIWTTFEGTVTGGPGVDMVKAGKGTLSIGAANGDGGLQLAAGDMRLTEGGLTLVARENALRSLTFAYSTAVGGEEELYEERGVTLRQGVTSVGSLVEEGSDASRRGGDIVLEDGAELALTGRSFISDSLILQGKGETGTLSIDTQAELTLGSLNDASAPDAPVRAAETATPDQLQGVRLHLKSGGVLNMALSSGTVSNMYGAGTLTGTGGVLRISGAEKGVFSGSMAGSGKLHVLSGGKLTLQDAAGGAAWNVVNEGSLVFDLVNNVKDVYLGEITLCSGSVAEFHLNSDLGEERSMLSAELFVAEKGARVDVYSVGEQMITDSELTLARVAAVESRNDVQNAQVHLNGVAFLHFRKDAQLYVKGENLMVGLEVSEGNEFITAGMHKNALAGAHLFWEASDTATSEHWAEIARNKDSDLYKMIVGLSELLEQGDTAGLHRTLAAGAGSSAAVLGSAVAKDVERQLRSIRNRTTTMGSELRYDGNNRLPLYRAWINGESSYHKMSADGLAPGYSLNSWGGTVGVDASVSAEATVGLAVSAMYGDLKTAAADPSRGDTTTTYLSGFARIDSGAWTHTFIATAGFADVKLDRTVSYGSGAYNTRGHTNGYQVGALYEIAYARALNAKKTTTLQGVANVELRHAALGSYSELNTEAGLHVDDISTTTITFGVGTRLQAVVAENALNRASILEARVLVKADAGDRRGTASTALIHGSPTSREVECAELGVLGVELGAGLTVPVGGKGAWFIDASAELRSGYTELNANTGYRMSF